MPDTGTGNSMNFSLSCPADLPPGILPFFFTPYACLTRVKVEHGTAGATQE